MEKIIIWGVGYQGTVIYELLKDDIIIEAFVDNNPDLIGSTYRDIKVISFEDYLNIEDTPMIIVSPRKSGSIIALLKDNDVSNYVVFSDLNDFENIKSISPKLYDIIKSRIFNLQKELIDNYVKFRYLNQRSRQGIIKDWKKILTNIRYPILSSTINKNLKQVYDVIFAKNVPSIFLEDLPQNIDLLIIYGLSFGFPAQRLMMEAEMREIFQIFADSGFIYSIVNNNTLGIDIKFTQSHSTVIDIEGFYINANGSSNMENILNSDFQLSEDQKQRAVNLINIIKSNKISKYNHQPIMKLNIGKPDRKKVLVIDQVYADQSINFGWANDQTFSDMLEAAIKENPDSDILVKTHPEGNVTKGYFMDIKFKQENVYKISFGINPISLLEQIDKVYVCTSQMGFEALMCGKEVHVFGMPFYAGWGVTKDRQICPRRTKRRSIEEIFYVAYIMCTIYVSYETNGICEIEQTIDEILKLREEYWNEQNITVKG